LERTKPIAGTGPRPPRQRLEYDYDSQSRRIAKRVLRKTHELGDWSLHQHRQFLYDGWNMIGELDVPTNGGTARLHRSYAWGLDASGTRTGAGGVGGLLLTTHYATPSSGTSSNVTLAPLYDLNSNVLAYADVTTSTITHRIDYDPFGNELTLDTLLPTAAAEEAPRFRFSTKYTDSESGLVYYGFRSYSPELGRWVNRDPIEERGGVNLYGMVGNDAVNRWDLLGMYVEVTYNRAAKSIIVRDVDTGATLTLKNVFSGNGRSCCRPEDEWKENEGPLPGGKYLIGLGYDSGHGGDDWWYKLYGDNGSGGYSYTDIPVVAPDGIIHHRGGFNLHTGRASDGCVTVWSDVAQGDTGYPKSDDYNKLKAMLDKTKPLEYKGSKFSGWLQVN